MNKNPKLLSVLFVFTVLVSACSGQPGQKLQPTALLESTDSGALPSNTVSTETPSPGPSPTDDSLAVGYKLGIGSPFNELERHRTPDIKEEIYFSSTAGGGGGIKCALPPDGHLPAITWWREPFDVDYLFCLAGFPDKQETVVEIYAPDGRFVSSKTFLIDGPDENKGILVVQEQNGFSAYSLHSANISENSHITEIRNNTRLFVFSLWFTEVGIPSGNWRVTASSGNEYAEVQVEVKAPDYPSILTLPDFYFDPFEDRPCRSYFSGEKIVVAGVGFKPDMELPLGIYRLTDQILPDPQFRVGPLYLAYLVSQGTIKTNADGQFGFTITLDARDQPGQYEKFGLLEYENEQELVTWSGKSSCFRVEDKKSSPTPSPSIPSDSADQDRFDVQVVTPTKDDIRSIQDIWAQINFQDLDVPGYHVYQPRLPAGQSIIWPYTWCASEGLLKENLAAMHVEFRIDNMSVSPANVLEYDDPPDGGSQYHQWVTMLQNLESEQHILLEINYTLTSSINDGWAIYPEGEYRHWIIATVE